MLGTTPAALARRGIGLDRLAVLTLRRDAYGTPPGPTRPLWLGERTQYRPAAWLLDPFERPDGDPGASYTPWLTTGVRIVAQAVTPATVASGAIQVSLHALTVPRDQWASGRITALGGTGAIGVALRVTGTAGYLVEAVAPATARIRRVRAGAVEAVLATRTVPWQLGDILAASVEWDRVRLYRNGVLLADVRDADPILAAGQAGVGGTLGLASDAAALSDFVAGPWRQEYVGALADLGDVSASLGLVEPTARPASWAMTVVNVAPLGGAARFSGLLRHGAQAGPDTYELARAPVTVSHAIRDGSAPLSVVHGRVVQPEALTESTVRLVCAGLDAFLTPAIRPGRVAYLPGLNPILTTAPVPADPCGADAVPTVEPGAATPDEPTIIPAPAPGVGPEAPARAETPASGGDGGGPSPPPGRVTYMVYDVNSHTYSPQTESNTPTGPNVIKPGDRPLNGDDVSMGISTHIIYLFRTGVIGVWAPSLPVTFGFRIRKTAADPLVYRCTQPGTTGAAPPVWPTGAAESPDGTAGWTLIGEVLPLTSPVPGTYLRLVFGLTLTAGVNPVAFRISRFIADGSAAYGAPADLDDTLVPSFNAPSSSDQLIPDLEAGGAYDLQIPIGDATAIMLQGLSTFEGSVTFSLSRAQFFTPEPP